MRSMNNWFIMHLHLLDEHRLFLLPALTLAVLDKRQLNDLVFHKGGPHQLRMEQRKSRLTTVSLLFKLILFNNIPP